MAETTPPLPRHASTKYTALKTAALAFITAQTHNPSLEEGMDTAALKQLVTPTFSHTFGPHYAVSRAPKLQGVFTIDGFIAHTQRMVPALEKWEMRVEGVSVDEVGEEVKEEMVKEEEVKEEAAEDV